MKTRAIYLDQPDLLTNKAVILAQDRDDTGDYLVLDQTIFYPQGGGQPSDQGVMEVEDRYIQVQKVRRVNDEIRHYLNLEGECDLMGKTVLCQVNPEARFLHSRLHSAGHVISNLIEMMLPSCKAAKGHHFPRECYVEFISNEGGLDEVSLLALNHEIHRIIGENIPTVCNTDQPVRRISIANLGYFPCGGTHIKHTGELTGLVVTKQKIKGHTLKISYDISN